MTRRSIKFDCHYCLNSVTAWQDECGHEIPCPHCKTVVIVPSQPIDANLFDDIFESLNPSALDVTSSSNPIAPETETAKPELENAVSKSTVSKTAAEAIAPKTEVSRATREARTPAAASSKDVTSGATISAASISKADPRATTPRAQPDSTPSIDSETSCQAAAKLKPTVLDKPQQNVMEQLLDEAAESPSASSGEQSDDLSGDHDLIALVEETSPEPDITDVPLKIDGWDFDQPTEVISLKCKICDSRIHTETSKIDTEIICPVCYTKILVTNALIDKLTPSKQGNPRETKMSYQSSGKPAQNDAAEIPLIPLETEAKAENSIPVLAPKASAGGGLGKSEVGQSSSKAIGSNQSMPAASSPDEQRKPTGKTFSRREKYEAAQRRLAGLDGPRRANKSKSRNPERGVESDSEQTDPSHSDQDGSSIVDAPVVEYSKASLWTMLSSPGLRWRAVLSAVVIGLGSGMMHRISRQYTELSEPSNFLDKLMTTLAWAGMGLLPYFIGVGLLWLLCGFVFREAASGNEQVSNWSIQSFGELKSTFLVFGFSFFIAGLPISPIPIMFAFVHPLRCLIAPLFLLSAWYSRNPLAIVSVDAFKHFRRESNEWGKFYMLAVGMGAMGFIGGLLMLVSVSGVSFITSLLGAVLVTMSTVIFAAATGWHCGWVVAGTRK